MEASNAASVARTITLRESLKTALAMTLAIGIALALDWDKPVWAGLAVSVCSLATIGQSLQKASLRMAGTLLALVAALIIIALFAQQRWWFIATLSLYGAICCYLMTGSRHAYFWNVCWFVAVIVVGGGSSASVNVFGVWMLRLMETGLGVLVYSLVSIFVWPQNALAPFTAAAINLVALQRELLQACLAMMVGRGDPDNVSQLVTAERRNRAGFDELLQAAIADSGEVWELRQQWRRFQQQLDQFSLTLSRWRETFAESKNLDMQNLLVGLEAFGHELDCRLGQVGIMLAGNQPERQPQTEALVLNSEALSKLSPLQKAAATVSHSHLLDIEQQTLDQFAGLSDIRGFSRLPPPVVKLSKPSTMLFVPDPERLVAAVRMAFMMWVSFLAGMYVPELPGGFMTMTVVGSIGAVMATVPEMRITRSLWVPIAAAIAFAAVLYVFIMPHLSSYLGLGTMIFLVTFSVCYICAAPPPAIGRPLALGMFLSLCGFDNEQTYNFLSIPITCVVIVAVIAIMNLSWYFPFNLFPERIFLRQSRRFFRSSGYLVSTLHGGWQPISWLERLRHAYHIQEVTLLPGKLAGWARLINPIVVKGTSPGDIQALVASIESLGIQLQQLLAQKLAAKPEALAQPLPPEFELWQHNVQSSLGRLASGKDMAAASRESQADLESIGKELTSLVGNSFAQNQRHYSEQQMERYYRLLDSCRGASTALFNCTRIMATMDWTPWQEERFA